MISNSKKYIIEIIKLCGSDIEGRKKLMKLCFFMNHYDFENNKKLKNPLFDVPFVVYHFGPFSFSVQEDYSELVKEGVIKDGFPIKLVEEVEYSLTDKEKGAIKLMLSKIGKLHGFQLEEKSLRVLGISKKDKKNLFGKEVREIIEEGQLELNN